jgi:uncharacterized membrane protein YhaH (DUF805 family)
MDMSLFTSFEGRINRQKWWLGLIVLVIAEWVIMFVITMFFGASMPTEVDPDAMGFSASYQLGAVGAIILLIIMIPVIWAGLALSAKRWHDRGKSAWWILIGLIPLIGAIWTLVENGFLKGTEGSNQYGPDPLAGT